jgi:uncharacterized protein
VILGHRATSNVHGLELPIPGGDGEHAGRLAAGTDESKEDVMAGHVDEMRERYDAFNQGDIGEATGNWAEDFVWEGGDSAELPGGGEHQGKDEALQVLQKTVGAWDEFKLSADEFFEDGDTVVVLGHTELKKGDKSAKLPVVHIWRWQGDEIKRLQILTDTFQTAKLLDVV